MSPPPLFRCFSVVLALTLCLGAGLAQAESEDTGQSDFSRATASNFRIPIRSSGIRSDSPAALFCGVPFPENWSVGPVEVLDAKGQQVPSSSRVMARWPDSEAIRWLGVDFLGRPDQEYFVVPATGKSGPKVTSLQVTEDANAFVVHTGPGKFILPKHGALIGQAYLDHNQDGSFSDTELMLENSNGDDLYAVDQEGTLAIIGGDAEDGQLRYETGAEKRPEGAPVLRAVFRREGWYVSAAGEKIARHITRLIFLAGEAKLKLEHSFILTDDTNKRWFKDYGLRLRYAKAAQPSKVFFPESDKPDAASIEVAFPPTISETYLFQEKAFFMSRMDPVEDCHFQIGKITGNGQDEVVLKGALAGNWILAANAQSGVGIAQRNFWQTFPKELNTSHEAMTLHLWSPRGGKELDPRSDTIRASWPKEWYNEHYASQALRARVDRMDVSARGLARSHEFVIALANAPAPKTMAAVANRTQTPTISLADPGWLRFTEAMGLLAPYSPEEFPEAEAFASEWFDQYNAIWRQWGDYGFFEFGNWPHVWYRKATKGPLEGRWHAYVDRYTSSIDYGTYAHLWRMFARTGDRKYFDAAVEATHGRLDLNMVHWDGRDFDEPFVLGRYNRLPERLKGSYATTNSPISWGRYSSMHHASATDLRALAYWYYLTDHRPAREMIASYTKTVKKIWKDNLSSLRGGRPFATLKNLATIYQETGDPALKPIVEDQVKYLVDLKAPQGVNREVERTGLAKYGVKAGSLQRTYEVTKNPLAADALVRGATTWATTSVGRLPMRYYEAEGELFATAYDISKDPILLRALLRDMKLTLSHYRDEDGEAWKPMWNGVGPSLSSNIYPLGGIAFAMDAISRAEKESGEKVELTPFARQGGYGDQVLAAFEKAANEEVILDVRSIHALSPILFDAKGNQVEGIIMEPFLDQLYTLEKIATRWKITLPASLPAGTYFVDSGYGGAMWEVTWTNAKKIVLYAPETYLLGTGGGKQWGNRIMPTQLDHREPVYFMVPKDSTQFEISSMGPVEFIRPSGEILALPGTDGQSQVVEVAEEDRGRLWALRTPGLTFVSLRGVPPFLAYGDPERYFLPEVGAEVLTKMRPPLPPEATMPAPEEDLYATFEGQPGEPRHGIVLSGQRRLSMAAADPELIVPQAGTLEFWVMPYWKSVDQLGESGKVHTLMDGGTWNLVFHRFGEMSATASVEGEKRNPKKPLAAATKAEVETNAGAILKTGRWTHLALQWKEDDGIFSLELYVDGRKQHDSPRDAGVASSQAEFSPAKAAKELLFGGGQKGRGDLDAVLGGLRFSNLPRYAESFDPRTSPTLEMDSSTTALFLFGGNAEGQVGAGKPELQATVLNP